MYNACGSGNPVDDCDTVARIRVSPKLLIATNCLSKV